MYWITGLLGAAFFLAPFLFGYTENSVALWTSLLLGGTVMFVSYLEATTDDKDRWEYWTAAIVGMFAIVAPFILGFGSHASAMWTSITVGMLIAVAALYRLYSSNTSYE